MKNFHERKQEYFKELINYTDIVKDMANDEKNSKIVDILLNPKNETELKGANLYLGFIKDIVGLSAQIQIFNPDIDVKNSALADYLEMTINTLNSDKSSEEKVESFTKLQDDGGTFYAKVIYEMIIYATKLDKILKEVCHRTDVDLNNELVKLQFTVAAKNVSKEVNKGLFNFTADDCEYLDSFCRKFHSLYKDGLEKVTNSEYNDYSNIEKLIEQTDKNNTKHI